MTNNLNQSQATEKLAHFLGWEKIYKGEYIWNWLRGDNKEVGASWNPLTDWNHWRMVEEKVIEDEELCGKFTDQLMELTPPEKYTWMKATLDQRISALLPLLPND